MPDDDLEGMVVVGVYESNGGKIGPTAVGELEIAGDEAAEGAVGNVDADPVGAAKCALLLRCTTIQGSRSSDHGSASALPLDPKKLAPATKLGRLRVSTRLSSSVRWEAASADPNCDEIVANCATRGTR